MLARAPACAARAHIMCVLYTSKYTCVLIDAVFPSGRVSNRSITHLLRAQLVLATHNM